MQFKGTDTGENGAMPKNLSLTESKWTLDPVQEAMQNSNCKSYGGNAQSGYSLVEFAWLGSFLMIIAWKMYIQTRRWAINSRELARDAPLHLAAACESEAEERTVINVL